MWRDEYQLGVTLSVLKVVDSLPECSGGYISEIELYSAFYLHLLFLLAGCDPFPPVWLSKFYCFVCSLLLNNIVCPKSLL